MTNKLRHQILGVCTLILFGMYLCVVCSSYADSFKRSGESFLRLSILLGAVWLAWDDLLRFPRWFYIFAPIMIAAVVVFKIAAVIVILILAALWLVLKFLKFITQPLTPQQRGPKRK